MEHSITKLNTQLILLSVLIMLEFACRDKGVEPPINTNKIKLTLIDTSVREVYLHIYVANPSNSETVTVLRNGVEARSFNAAITDTMFADTGLVANTRYIYQALRQMGGIMDVKSNEVRINTLTPTSHSFTWQTFVLGGGDDSWLRDVTIIDQDNIWAVGWINVRDLSGQVDPNSYNAVNWNGRDTQLIRIPTKIWNTSSYITGELKAIYSINSSNILVSTGGQVVWYDGRNWGGDQFLFADLNDTTFGGLDRFAGFDQFRIWGVGDKGNIFYYGGNNWQRISSGTTTPINDVLGVINPVNQKEEIYCAVSDIFQFKDRKILKLVDGQIDSVSWNAQRDVVISLWTNRGFPMYVGGGLGLYENKTGAWQKVDFGGTKVYPSSVRGTSLNNIVVVGSFGLIAHCNGIDWKVLTDVYDAFYTAVAVKGNTVAAVGSKNGRAILIIGKQN